METQFIIGKEIFPVRMNGVEVLLQEMQNIYRKVHPEIDIHIYFSGGKRGYKEGDYHLLIGDLKRLILNLSLHCKKCEDLWKKNKNIFHTIILLWSFLFLKEYL